MARKQREIGKLFYYKVKLDMKVIDRLYASSPTSEGGIISALKRNMPSESQVVYREALGEVITPIDELERQIEEAIEPAIEAGLAPSTVFRRDKDGRPYLHDNYLIGHLRDQGKTLGRMLNFWALEDFIGRTIHIVPKKHYLEGGVKVFTHGFAPEVRQRTGITVRQATEKSEEFVDSPTLNWMLYLVADPRWSRELLDQLLLEGSIRGIGPGRARRESQYTYELGEFEKVDRPPLEAWGIME